ncbi:hypothetical protein Taro_001497 [Colocasia esculenta]|uniref:Uncharacterized protein n=1 Tax=Colocasia esculenta TaxID=4460 RepID=A0A843TI39_COLES|nr:hypothetical protein [Colocasia esculenta]
MVPCACGSDAEVRPDLDVCAKHGRCWLGGQQRETGENGAYESSKIYKAKTKTFHERHIHRNFFEVHDKVWLFNSRLRLFSGKLKSRQDGLYSVVKTCDNGAIMILDPKTGQSFTVKGQRLKHFFESPLFLKMDSTKLAEPNEA